MAVMLAAGQRLRRSSEFAAAIRGGRRTGRGALVVHLTMPPGDTVLAEDAVPAEGTVPAVNERAPSQSAPAGGGRRPARAGLVVSRAVGGAVVRNAVRRRLRHLARERLSRLPAGSVLVVRALPAAATASFAQLGADLDAALSAARTSGQGRRRNATVGRKPDAPGGGRARHSVGNDRTATGSAQRPAAPLPRPAAARRTEV